MHTLVFDVYGTLVDPTDVTVLLESRLGENAVHFANQWRKKQLEYSYRMGLMRWYQPFSQCSKYAFEYTCEEFGVSFTDEEKKALFLRSLSLPAYDDAEEALKKFSQTDAGRFAFSNGVAEDVEAVLTYSNLRPYLQEVVSVDAIKIFKPSRIAYGYLLERIALYNNPNAEESTHDIQKESTQLDMDFGTSRCLHYVESGLDEQEQETVVKKPAYAMQDASCVWLISSNPFDVIGAKVAGLQAVWIKRSPTSVFDPWGVEPTLTVATLTELYDVLRYRNVLTLI